MPQSPPSLCTRQKYTLTAHSSWLTWHRGILLCERLSCGTTTSHCELWVQWAGTKIVLTDSHPCSRRHPQTLSVPLSAKLGFPAPVLRLINAPTSFSHPSSQPIHRLMPPSHGKHHACSLASHSACLFLSPSLLPIHLDSLYTLYLSIFSPAYKQSQADPSSHSQTSSSPAPSPPLQAAAIVNADTYYRLQHLRFENHEVDLHTGLLLASPQSDLQEHIASKEASRRWFRQMYTLNPDFAIGDDAADAVWSTWMNAPPRLVNTFMHLLRASSVDADNVVLC